MANGWQKGHRQRSIQKIKDALLVDRLIKHALGEVEMSASQVNAARVLLNKTFPDLKAVEHSGESTVQHSVDAKSVEQAAQSVLDKLQSLRQ